MDNCVCTTHQHKINDCTRQVWLWKMNKLTKMNLLKHWRRGWEYNLVLGEPSSNGPSLFGAQIQGQVFLLAVGFAQTGLLCLTDDRQHLSDGQPHHLDLGKLIGSTACHLSYSQKCQLRLQLLQLQPLQKKRSKALLPSSSTWAFKLMISLQT